MKIGIQFCTIIVIFLSAGLFTACDDDSESSANEQNEQNEQNENAQCNGGCTCSHCKCACDEGFHFYEDDCEEDTINHCGSHGNACSTESFSNSKTVACVKGKCAVETCINDYHLNRTGQCETCSGNTIWNDATQSCDERSEPVNCAELINNVKKGDSISFGRYWQKSWADGLQPIEWLVLDNEHENGVLLISKYILDVKPCVINDINGKEVTWETSSMRSWLNGLGASENFTEIDFRDDNFMKTAFNAEEMECIATVLNHTNDFEEQGQPKYTVSGGNDTNDKVFLLSIEEAVSFYKTVEERMAYCTPYARFKSVPIDPKTCVDDSCVSPWTLRSPGRYKTYTTCSNVTTSGTTSQFLDIYDPGSGVRPAIVLKR